MVLTSLQQIWEALEAIEPGRYILDLENGCIKAQDDGGRWYMVYSLTITGEIIFCEMEGKFPLMGS